MTPWPRRALRAALTLAFLYFGLTKLLGADQAVRLYADLGYGQWPRFVTGTVETLGALALWTPLSPAAALILFGTMVVGFTAKILLVGPPVWDILTLGVLVIALLLWDLRARIG